LKLLRHIIINLTFTKTLQPNRSVKLLFIFQTEFGYDLKNAHVFSTQRNEYDIEKQSIHVYILVYTYIWKNDTIIFGKKTDKPLQTYVYTLLLVVR